MSPDPAAIKPEIGASGRKIIYGPDGKPCRSCNTLLDFRMATGGPSKGSAKSTTVAATAATAVAANGTTEETFNNGYKKDCPPDVLELGHSTWTLLHSIAASYPENPTQEEQDTLSTFIQSFSKLYPCWFCAKDFRKYIANDKPKVTNSEEFGRWLCDAHNAVNIKTGKETFDCNLWKERWKDGWKDGSCD